MKHRFGFVIAVLVACASVPPAFAGGSWGLQMYENGKPVPPYKGGKTYLVSKNPGRCVDGSQAVAVQLCDGRRWFVCTENMRKMKAEHGNGRKFELVDNLHQKKLCN
jgi:hypothetical protein